MIYALAVALYSLLSNTFSTKSCTFSTVNSSNSSTLSTTVFVKSSASLSPNSSVSSLDLINAFLILDASNVSYAPSLFLIRSPAIQSSSLMSVNASTAPKFTPYNTITTNIIIADTAPIIANDSAISTLSSDTIGDVAKLNTMPMI